MIHENIINELNDNIEKNKIKHAYIFSGHENIGKLEIAIDFARKILCKEKIDFEIFNNKNHPDYKIISPDDKDSIKVESVRDLVEDINIKPIRSEYKVYIIDQADKITKQGQNALLKTFEEPPKYVVIILVTSKYYALLDTIRSRGQKIDFLEISKEYLIDEFEKKHIDTKIPKKYFVELLNGSLNNIEDVLKNETIILELIQYLDKKQNKLDMFKMSKKLNDEKENIFDILEYLILIFSFRIKYENFSNTEIIKMNKCINLVETTKNHIKSNINYEIAIDYLLTNMWEAMYD